MGTNTEKLFEYAQLSRYLHEKVPIIASVRHRDRNVAVAERAKQLRLAKVLSWPVRFASLYDAVRSVVRNDLPMSAAKVRLNDSDDAGQVKWPSSFKPRVLVVDDSKINRSVAVMLLQRLGCVVETNINGMEALDHLRAALSGSMASDASAGASEMRYDIILMDVNMPMLNGRECTREIRRIEEDCGLERQIVIAMTGDTTGETEAECMEAGMDGLVQKPVKIKLLREVIQKFLIEGTRHHEQEGGDAAVPGGELTP